MFCQNRRPPEEPKCAHSFDCFVIVLKSAFDCALCHSGLQGTVQDGVSSAGLWITGADAFQAPCYGWPLAAFDLLAKVVRTGKFQTESSKRSPDSHPLKHWNGEPSRVVLKAESAHLRWRPQLTSPDGLPFGEFDLWTGSFEQIQSTSTLRNTREPGSISNVIALCSAISFGLFLSAIRVRGISFFSTLFILCVRESP